MYKKTILTMALAISLLITHTVSAQEPGVAVDENTSFESKDIEENENVATATVYSQESYSEAFEVLELVNEERQKEGVAPLIMDRSLLEAAMLRGSEIGIYFSHTRPINEACFTACDKMYGENIAAGQGSAASVMNSWMNSEGHRSNILDEDYQSIGIGAVLIN